jgi:hypothetical protein
MTLHDVTPYVVHEGYVEDHRFDGLRSGEGSVAALTDDSLLLIYGKFDGPSDEDRATLLARRSRDGGQTWSQPSVYLRSPPDSLNVMSVSLLRLRSGAVAAMHLHKHTKQDCRAWLSLSVDGGRTFPEPRCITQRPIYHVVNNDRMIQLADGRLLVPYHHYPQGPGRGYCGCVYSDDDGRTWHYSTRESFLTPQTAARPALSPTALPELVEAVEQGDLHVREPGVVELLDGRVMMWARSTGGYVYRCYSRDRGETWGPFEAFLDLPAPNGPQSVCRLPGSKRLVMLLNHRGPVPFGHHQFQWRRPLSVAVSDDDAATWKLHGLLEPDTVPSNCYYSICFHGSNLIFTYYEGVMRTDEQGLFVPRNLASLKCKVVRREYFEQG